MKAEGGRMKGSLQQLCLHPSAFILSFGGAAFEGVAHLRAECFVAAHEVL
jgi:hypothetical protein